jgi:hypothetical protein
MNRLQFLILHCLLTPRGRWITKGDLQMWHLGPKDLPSGKVRYFGKDYDSRDVLPLVKYNGVWIRDLHGRGWDRLGYADLIHYSGAIENLTPYDKDDFVDKEEITWGAVGVNSVSRHVALEGGIHPLYGNNGCWPFAELYSDAQFIYLASYLKQTIQDHPQIKIMGHYQVPKAGKTCPNFDVPDFCRSIGINEVNIG